MRGDNAANPSQQLGGDAQAFAGLQGPFQTNSNRKKQVQEANSPARPISYTKEATFSTAFGLLLFLLPEILCLSRANLVHSTSCFRCWLSWCNFPAHIYGVSTI